MPVVHPTSSSFQGVSVIGLTPGATGWHSGIFYKPNKQTTRYLHLAWHLQLRDEAVPEEGWWVQSALRRRQKLAVAVRAALIAERYRDGALPYCLRVDYPVVLKDGTIKLGGGHGLTCASLISLVHESVGAPLVVVESWAERSPSRVAADNQAQQRLVELMRRSNPNQAKLMASEVGCTRVRSEEVAGASGLPHRPAPYKVAKTAGEDVLRQLPASSVSCTKSGLVQAR